MIYTQNLKLSVPRKIVLIGASTGGPGIIQKIITALPQLNDVSIIVAQHMARGFIPSFAKRLQTHTQNDIYLVQDGLTLEPNSIYLCRGHTSIIKNHLGLRFTQEDSPDNAFNPDINIVFNSFLPFTNDITMLSVILTGIGDDGVSACKALSIKGVRSLTETEKSAVVDGMPSRARERIPDIESLNVQDIIKTIKEFTTNV